MSMEFARKLMPAPKPALSSIQGKHGKGPIRLSASGIRVAGMAGKVAGVGRTDRAEISPMSRSLAQVQKITSEALQSLQDRHAADYEALMDAGKGEFLEGFASNTDSAAAGTAKMILNGITGYIFGAFAVQYPEMTQERLDEFFREATKGVNRGFGEAKDYLEGMSLFDGSIKDDATSAIEMVHEGLAAFIEEQKQALRQQGQQSQSSGQEHQQDSAPFSAEV